MSSSEVAPQEVTICHWCPDMGPKLARAHLDGVPVVFRMCERCRRDLAGADQQPDYAQGRRELIARAAATDAGNQAMRAARRTAWSREDYAAAVAEFERLAPSPDRDPGISWASGHEARSPQPPAPTSREPFRRV